VAAVDAISRGTDESGRRQVTVTSVRRCANWLHWSGSSHQRQSAGRRMLRPTDARDASSSDWPPAATQLGSGGGWGVVFLDSRPICSGAPLAAGQRPPIRRKRPMRSDRLMPPIRRQRVVTATGRWKAAGRPRRWLPPGSVRRRMKHPTNGFDCVLLVRRLMLDRPGPGTDESTFRTCRPFFWGRPASRSNQISGRRPRAAAASP
jgi:hypothetical protein